MENCGSFKSFGFIYIYIDERPYVRKYEVLPCDTFFVKKIEILSSGTLEIKKKIKY